MPSSTHLPSLLRNLTSSSNRSTASVSFDSPSTSTLSNDDSQSVTSRSSRTNASRRRRVVTDPAPRSIVFGDSPTSTRPPSPRPVTKDSPRSRRLDRETSSEGARSRSSSGSSLEGLTARLHGARRGKKGPVQNAETTAESSLEKKGKGKQRDAEDEEPVEEDPTKVDDNPDREFSSVPTISLSTDQVEFDHGTTRIVTPDPSESPPPLIVPSPFDSPALSTDSSAFDTQPPPPPRIQINKLEQNEHEDDTVPVPTTFASSLDPAENSDAENDTSPSFSDEDRSDNAESETGSLNVVSRSEPHPDPRELLRSQLAKAATGQGENRTGEESDVDGIETSEKRRTGMSRTVSGMSQRSAVSAKGAVTGQATTLVCEKRRYFILSTAGKLVYTSDADEDMASGLVGVMQAIVSIFADEGDKIRCVEVGDSRITFLLKSPLYLVVSSSWGEPESVLRTHLDYLYLQVLSVVTLTQLQSIFSRRSNFDLRRMMEGTEPFFHSLVGSLQTSIPILTSTMEVYRLEPNVRAEIAKALDSGREVTKKLDLLYVLLLARGRLVTLLRPKKHSIHPTDLHLLLSSIYSSSPRSRTKSDSDGTSLNITQDEVDTALHDEEEDDHRRSSPLTEPGLESWLPICLPRFNATGFLHAYVSFLAPSNTLTPTLSTATATGGGGSGVGLVLLSSDREGFLGVKAAAEGIKERLLSSTGTGGDGTGSTGNNGKGKNRKGGKAAGGLVHEIEKARGIQEYSLGELAIPGLRHFVYKSRSLVQSTRPAWEGDYLALTDRYRLVTLYQQLSDALHPRPAQSGSAARKPVHVQYLRTEHEAVLGWATPQFELYVATSPLLPHSAVVAAAKGVSKWVEKEEQKLFLTSSPSF